MMTRNPTPNNQPSLSITAWAARHRWDLAAVGLLIVTALALTLAIYPYSYDDAYITYRYARNLALGQGFVFTQGETHLGTTAPLWGLLLGVIGIPWPDAIPALGGWLSGLAIFAAALGLYEFGRMHQQRLAGLTAGMVFLCNPVTLETFGGEALAVAALVIWAFVLFLRGHWGWTGALIGLATLMRGDAALAGGIVGLLALVSRRRIPWRMAFAFLAVMTPWLTYSYSLYGSFFPDTVAVKIAQGESGRWTTFLGGIRELLKIYLGPRLLTMQGIFGMQGILPFYRLMAVSLVLGVGAVLARRFWLLPLAWVALHGLGYTLLRVPFYHWYYIPEVVGLAILVGAGTSAAVDLARLLWQRATGRATDRRVEWAAAALMLALVALPLAQSARHGLTRHLAIQLPISYPAVGRYLAANTPPDASIGYPEVGMLGYFSDRTVVDPMGLVTGVSPDHIRNGDLSWAYRELLPDYILTSDRFYHFLGPYMQETWFKYCYQLIADVEELDLWQRCTVMNPNDRVELEAISATNDAHTGALSPDNIVGQMFTVSRPGLRTVAVLFGTHAQAHDGEVTLHLRRAADLEIGPDLRTVQVPAEKIEDNTWHLFHFEPLMDPAGTSYYVYLEYPTGSEDNKLELWRTTGDSYPGGTLYQNHQAQPGDLSVLLYFVKKEAN